MTEQSPEIWAGVATQYVGAWGQAAPMVQIAAITATEVRYKKGGKMVTLAMPKG